LSNQFQVPGTNLNLHKNGRTRTRSNGKENGEIRTNTRTRPAIKFIVDA